MRALRLVVPVLAFVACTKAPAVESTPDGCPKDLLAARGTPCASAGKTCGLTSSTTHFIMCSGGKWGEMSAPPPPPPRPPG